MFTKKEELNFPVTNAAKCLNQKEVSNIIPKFTLENISSGNSTIIDNSNSTSRDVGVLCSEVSVF